MEVAMKKHWRTLIISVTFLLLAVAYLVVDFASKSSCEGIFQQTEQKLQADIEILKAKGGLFMGSEKIQDLTERSQITALNFKGCCIAADNGLIDKAQFLECKNNLSTYESQVASIVRVVEQVGADQPNELSPAVQMKREEVDTLFTKTVISADRIEEIAKEIGKSPIPGPGSKGDADRGPPVSAETEPNNDFFTANEIEIGGRFRAEIQAQDDQDVFKFNNTSSLRDWARIRFENRSMTLAPDIFLYNAKKVQMSETYESSPGADQDVYFVVEVGQDYYVRVPFYQGVGKYELTMETLKSYDAHEPNDVAESATSIMLSEEVSANILDARDTDWYRFTAPRDGELRVVFRNESTTLAPDLFLYNANKAQLQEQYNSTPGADHSLVFTAQAGQDYFVRVPFYQGRGAYSLTIE
jgi:hypothetical protein